MTSNGARELKDRINKLWIVNERVAVALNVKNDVVAVTLLIGHWILSMPILQRGQVSDLTIVRGGRTVGSSNTVDHRECNAIAIGIPIVTDGHVKDHASNVSLDFVWRFKAVTSFQTNRTVFARLRTGQLGSTVGKVLGRSLSIDGLVCRTKSMDIGASTLRSAKVTVGLGIDMFTVPSILAIATIVLVDLWFRTTGVEKNDVVSIARILIGSLT